MRNYIPVPYQSKISFYSIKLFRSSSSEQEEGDPEPASLGLSSYVVRTNFASPEISANSFMNLF